MPATAITEHEIWEALQDVPDPEIPAISVVDLGIISSVAVDGERVSVEIMPTFIGCPAIGIMCADVHERLTEIAAEVDVRLDSKLVVEQLSGRWKIRQPHLRPLAAEATELLGRFRRTKLSWVPRAANASVPKVSSCETSPFWLPDLCWRSSRG